MNRVGINVALIVCDNGLGHLRRCCFMAFALQEEGKSVTLFASRLAFNRLKKSLPFISTLKLHDFSTHTSVKNFESGEERAREWLSRLPSLEAFDTVYSDNLLEILEVRSDAILSSQFFWHDAVKNVEPEYFLYCTQLLEKYRPKILGCDLFAMRSVREQPGYEPVSLYKNPELVTANMAVRRTERRDLLITGGTTTSVRPALKSLVAWFHDNPPDYFDKVRVDMELMPISPPSHIVQADFTNAMFTRLAAAICRPGLGILTDLLTVGVNPVTVFEAGNDEMLHNDWTLRSKGLVSSSLSLSKDKSIFSLGDGSFHIK